MSVAPQNEQANHRNSPDQPKPSGVTDEIRLLQGLKNLPFPFSSETTTGSPRFTSASTKTPLGPEGFSLAGAGPAVSEITANVDTKIAAVVENTFFNLASPVCLVDSPPSKKSKGLGSLKQGLSPVFASHNHGFVITRMTLGLAAFEFGG